MSEAGGSGMKGNYEFFHYDQLSEPSGERCGSVGAKSIVDAMKVDPGFEESFLVSDSLKSVVGVQILHELKRIAAALERLAGTTNPPATETKEASNEQITILDT